MNATIDGMSDRLVATKEQFMELIKEVPSCGSALDPQVRQYLAGIVNWIRGVDCWEFGCGRYFGDKGREYQISGQGNMLPKAR